MKDKKKIWIASLAVLIASGALGVTLAFFTDTKEQKNVFVMGNVGITLTEPEFEKQTDGTYEMVGMLPNQIITKDPIIHVNEDSLDVYLRAELSYDGLNEEEMAELEQEIAFEADWHKGNDGYFYYNKKASKGESIPVFHSLTIPHTWGTETLTKGFQLKVRAEAIQADYFVPETSSINGENVILSWLNKDGSSITMQE